MKRMKKCLYGVGGWEKRVARTSAAAQVAGGSLQYVVCEQRPRGRPSQSGGVRLEGGAPIWCVN